MVSVFHSIDNFRDLADTVQRKSRVCSNKIFRSATLDYATEDDLEKLVAELNVNTIIDLRSEVEANIAKLGKPFVSFPVATAMKLKASDITDAHPEASVHERTDGPTRKTVMINFAGAKFRKYAVWKAAPLKTKMQIVGLVASGQKPRAVKLVGEEIIAKKGLTGLYRDFVDYCDQEICEALHVLSDPSNYPVLVHCTQGKDRTGLVSALALAAAGIDEDKIIEDYSKSQQGLARVREHMVKEMEKDGLDSSFADAPPDVMKKTFEYIREKYTTVYGYLDYIGFGEKQREELSKALTFKAMQVEVQHGSHPQTQNNQKTSDGATTQQGDHSSSHDEDDDEDDDQDDHPHTHNERDDYLPTQDYNASKRRVSTSNAISHPSGEGTHARVGRRQSVHDRVHDWRERKHDRARNASVDFTSASSAQDSGVSSGAPWSPDARNGKPQSGKSIEVPIGSGRRRSVSDTHRGIIHAVADPRAGVQLMSSGLGVHLPVPEGRHHHHHHHHRRSSSDDVNSREAARDDGFLPNIAESPLESSSPPPLLSFHSPPPTTSSSSSSSSHE